MNLPVMTVGSCYGLGGMWSTLCIYLVMLPSVNWVCTFHTNPVNKVSQGLHEAGYASEETDTEGSLLP